MNKLTATNLVAFVKQLDRKIAYHYINPSNKGQIEIIDIESPEGPIKIKRWDSSKGQTPSAAKIESISTEMIWRIANALIPNHPINFERILGASYNTRSVFEALLAHTPQFHFCYPGRIEDINGHTTVKSGHKHIIWEPENPHQLGKTHKINTSIVISEIPSLEAAYDALVLPQEKEELTKIDIDLKRRHAQIQIALYFIGHQLDFRTWIAQNDKGILYKNKKIGEFDGVISTLRDEKLIAGHEDAIKAALLIDCIWFKNGRLMPAVMEVEHTTGVNSGLSRMKNFKDKFPPFPTRYVIVAPDEDRDRVIREATKEQFRDLNTRFFSYSAVEELYALCQRRKLRGVTEEFLDCYMEPVLNN